MKNYKLYNTEPISDLKEMVKKCTNHYGNKNAINEIYDDYDKSKTYKRLANDINAFGTALIELKLKGKHIALIGDNSYEWIVTYLSVVNGVGVIVPIDKDLPVNEIKYISDHGDVCAIVYSDRMKDRILQLQNQLPQISLFISISSKDLSYAHLSFDTLLERGRSLLADGNRSYLDVTIDPDKLCSILYTSGTTGTSKGVMLSHRNITSVIVGGLNNLHIGPSVLSALPVHHSYEAVCGIFTMLYNGTEIYINDSLQNFMSNLKRTKPTNLFLVPAFVEKMYKGIWDNAKKAGKEKLLKTLIRTSSVLLKLRIDLRRILFKSIHDAFGGNLQMITCGGAPLSPNYVKGFAEIGILLMNGYGITECAPLVAVNRNKCYNEYSVGKVISCCKVKIESPDQDGEGEILVKGTNVMLGYYKNSEATKEVFTEDGWFRTGDYGHLDNSGFLFITGRKKNLIVLKSGKNIYPEEIEGYLLACNLVKEVVVLSKEEKEGRESALIAEVYPDLDYAKQNGVINLEQTLLEEVKAITENLPYYKRVSRIEIRQTEFEKTSTKKIKRFAINRKPNNSSSNISNGKLDYVKPENELQELIEKLMCDTLNLEKISINQDLFEFGLDSLGVMDAVATLSVKGIEINVIDIYKARTIKEISNIINDEIVRDADLEIAADITEDFICRSTKSEVKNVLLTGATGYLGSHILAEIMKSTSATVYCLVRDQQRFYEILPLYFGNQLANLIENRTVTVLGDITSTNLGLSVEDYTNLSELIDTTIHSAANVHHIADINESEKVNVIGTENIIRFARKANSSYHHISTIAISGENIPGKTGEVIFDETKFFIGQNYNKNVYVQSKFKAEKLVLQHIKNGLDGRIYRVGNLTWREDGKFQKNVNENGFLLRLSAFKKIGAYPQSMADYEIDFTPVNECAEAVVKIAIGNDNNRIYHLYNHNRVRLADIMRTSTIKVIDDEEFYDLMLQNKDSVDVSILMFYIKEFSKLTNTGAVVKINNDKTKMSLEKLGFAWSKITPEYIGLYHNILAELPL
ncbi:MAG: AMP-binding protein [Herbinix sp.]|nr:AMP-binding protein [Herbinix sp.]